MTIDTKISQLMQKSTSLPSVIFANAPNDNALEPKLYNDPDSDGTILSPTLLTPSRKVPKQRTNGYTIDLVNGDIIATKDWFQTEVDTDEETIENYLEVWYLEDNVRRQFPDLHIFNSYIGTLLSSFIELEIILIEKEDLDLIPTGTPMEYNTR